MCSCVEVGKPLWQMKGPQPQSTFHSVFEISAAQIEEELVCTRGQLCLSKEAVQYDLIDSGLSPLHLLKWCIDANFLQQQVFVEEWAI